MVSALGRGGLKKPNCRQPCGGVAGITRSVELHYCEDGRKQAVMLEQLNTDNSHQMKDVFANDSFVLKLSMPSYNSLGKELCLQQTPFGALCLRHVAYGEVSVGDLLLEVALQPRVQFPADKAVCELLPLLDSCRIPMQPTFPTHHQNTFSISFTGSQFMPSPSPPSFCVPGLHHRDLV